MIEQESDVFGRYLSAVKKLDLAVEVFMGGVETATSAVLGIDAIRRLEVHFGRPDPFSDPLQLQQARAKAEEVQEFARAEKEGGNPYLHGLATIRLWSIIENMIDDLTIYLLAKLPKSREGQVVKGLKVPFVDFIDASESERIELLASELKQAVKAKLRPGIGRFESILDALNFGGPVADAVKRSMLEHSQVRNILVHKDGKADARLVEQCPWLAYSVGDEVHVSHAQFRQFVLAANWYLVEMDKRLIISQGDNRSKLSEDEEIQSLTLDALLHIQKMIETTRRSPS